MFSLLHWAVATGLPTDANSPAGTLNSYNVDTCICFIPGASKQVMKMCSIKELHRFQNVLHPNRLVL